MVRLPEGLYLGQNPSRPALSRDPRQPESQGHGERTTAPVSAPLGAQVFVKTARPLDKQLLTLSPRAPPKPSSNLP